MISNGSSRRSMAHLDPEEIAALVDRPNRVPGHDYRLEHLSTCESCYELFAETARLVHGTTGSIPLGAASSDDKRHSHKVAWRRRTAWAAGLVAAALVALMVWTPLTGPRRPTNILPAVDLAASLVRSPRIDSVLAERWDERNWPVTLGQTFNFGDDEQRSFRLGVRVVELELALATGQHDLSENLISRIDSLLAADELSATVRTFYTGAGGLREGLQLGRPDAELLALARQADDLIGPQEGDMAAGFAEPFWYAFGKWSAAGELAAATGNEEYLSTTMHRRFLERLQEIDLPPVLAEEFQALDKQLGRREFDYALLAKAYGRLITVAGGGSVRSRN